MNDADEFHAQRLTNRECLDLFGRLFPAGLSGPDVLRELAPQGWENSPLLATFHPSLDQVYRETVQLHRNIESLPWRDKARPLRPEPTLEEVAREYSQTPVEVEIEVRELVGKSVWDIFSDGHDVTAPDGRMADIGSFRGAAGFIAEYLNLDLTDVRYDYIDFYMGTIWIAQRADLAPVYEMIFRRLKTQGYDWIYQFPKLGLVDLLPLKKTLDAGPPGKEWESYSPSEAFAEEGKRQKEDEEIADARASLEQIHKDAVQDARNHPPPRTVEAYRKVFNRFPRGWPPWESDTE